VAGWTWGANVVAEGTPLGAQRAPKALRVEVVLGVFVPERRLQALLTATHRTIVNSVGGAGQALHLVHGLLGRTPDILDHHHIPRVQLQKCLWVQLARPKN